MIEFAYKYLLLLLPGLIPLFWYIWTLRPQPSLKVPSTGRFVAAGAVRRRVPLIPFILYLAGSVLLITALARPRVGNEHVVVRAEGIDIILALDLSGSMEVTDLPKDIQTQTQLEKAINSAELLNRFEVAKKEIARFIEARPNDRIGLIGFSEVAYNISPPTLDHGWLLSNLQELRPGILGSRTGIASPLASGIKRLESTNGPRKVLVLFTDGANNVQDRITPLQAAELAKGANVVIYTVGIGGNRAIYYAKNPDGTYSVRPAGSDFDEESLKEIASVADGRYFHADDAEGFKAAMDEINQLEKTTVEQPKFVEYHEYGPLLAAIAMLLILAAFAVERTWELSIP